MKIGYFLSSEEWGPRDLVSLAVKAEQAGFDGLWISDHFHRWNEEQGHSPFVWSTIGAIASATDNMKVTTATGEAGCRARGGPARLEHRRSYELPESPPQIVISGFGPKAVDVAARIGDGYVTVGPDSDSVEQFRSKAKRGKQVQGGLKVCWDRDESKAVETVHRLWPNDALPGELAQVLPTPEHFEQASELVTPGMVASDVPCGPDLERQIEKINEYADAGFDELYIQQIGPEQDVFFEVYRERVLPRVR